MNAPATLDVPMEFASDNTGPAHPEVLRALAEANEGAAPGYGADRWTQGVVERIRALFEAPEAAVHLVATGTAANSLALATLGQPWQTVFCTEMAHIHEDECNAPEFFTGGAKLTPLPAPDAKLAPETLRAAMLREETRGVHGPQRGPVSITQATEKGTVYSVAEVAALAEVARGFGQALHMDGARFANALVATNASPAEMTWRAGVDALSFGGTKNGLLGRRGGGALRPRALLGVRAARKRSRTCLQAPLPRGADAGLSRTATCGCARPRRERRLASSSRACGRARLRARLGAGPTSSSAPAPRAHEAPGGGARLPPLGRPTDGETGRALLAVSSATGTRPRVTASSSPTRVPRPHPGAPSMPAMRAKAHLRQLTTCPPRQGRWHGACRSTAASGGACAGAEVERFNDQEIFVEVFENVRGEDMFIIQSTSKPANDTAHGALHHDRRAAPVLRPPHHRRDPLFRLRRQDRRAKARTPISAKLVANLLTTAGVDRVLTLDLHAAQIQGFFDIPWTTSTPRRSSPSTSSTLQRRHQGHDRRLPRRGRRGPRRGARAAHRLQPRHRRQAPAQARRGRRDDGDRRREGPDLRDRRRHRGHAGTLAKAAQTLCEAGAKEVHAYITHGVLSGPGRGARPGSMMKSLVITDSIEPSEPSVPAPRSASSPPRPCSRRRS
jgi:hypothetical protein